MSAIAVDFHLVVAQKFSAGGWANGKPSVRAAKSKPALGPNEVAIAVKLELPASLFKRPSMQAKIVVPDDQAPAVITPEVEQNIAAALRDQFGITLHISAPQPPGE